MEKKKIGIVTFSHANNNGAFFVINLLFIHSPPLYPLIEPIITPFTK
mgnify:CR=1 FL=1